MTRLLLIGVLLLAAPPAPGVTHGFIQPSRQATSQSPDAQAVERAKQAFDLQFRIAGSLGSIETEDDVAAIARRALQNVDLASISPESLADLVDSQLYIRLPADLEAKLNPRANELRHRPDAYGAVATYVYHTTLPKIEDASQADRDQKDLASRLELLHHPGLVEALDTPAASTLLWFLQPRPDIARELKGELLHLTNRIGNIDLQHAASLTQLYEAIVPWSTPEELEGPRTRIIEIIRRAREAVPEQRDFLDDKLALLDGAWARGRLIDHQAPRLTVEHATDGELTSLHDLHGNVVVLDFWATWCGPCIAAFPRIKALRQRYKGFDVRIVGVTGLQGYHITPEGKRIATQGQADREYALMRRFIESHNLSWPTVFATEGAFAPDYGVTGIPHMTIIDASGKVRFNGIHPGSPLKEHADRIDALLIEAGLPAPEPIEQPVAADSGR